MSAPHPSGGPPDRLQTFPRNADSKASPTAGAADPLAPLVDVLADRIAERVVARLPVSSAARGYLDVDGAASYLACPRSRVYDLVAQRRVRHVKDGRRLLFRAEWLDAALEDGPA